MNGIPAKRVGHGPFVLAFVATFRYREGLVGRAVVAAVFGLAGANRRPRCRKSLARQVVGRHRCALTRRKSQVRALHRPFVVSLF